MSNASLIIGESGTGKSTSLRTLNPAETFIINVLNKPLPFQGYKANYKMVSADGLTGNYYTSDNFEVIKQVVGKINKIRPDIKNLVIDDFQYVMAHEYMRRCLERGFDKFAEMGNHAWGILEMLTKLRDDLNCYVLTHSEANESGKMKVKTIGNMIDKHITFEGMFTVVLQTEISDGKYSFITQGDARHIAKSPMGMFDTKEIPNDLAFVNNRINQYYGDCA